MRIWLILGALGSTGDQQQSYQYCAYGCQRNCDSSQLDWILRFTHWTCLDDCKYHCMHQITDKAVQNRQKIHQYHGKWPFYRLWGMQEPASVLFSILNGYNHFKGLKRYSRLIGPRFEWRGLMVCYGFAAINTWFWSAVFHTRDLPFTEKMDYFSAMFGILFALFYSFHRIARIRLFSAFSMTLILLFTFFYIAHVSYLSFYKFDYGYNMTASIVVGLVHTIVWLGWVLLQYKAKPYAYKMAVCVLSLCAAMSLELLDFPPIWRIFDAHSLWHAATIPVVRIYWDFVTDDAIAESRSRNKQAD